MGLQLASEQLDGAVPVYLQIAGAIRAQVEDGTLASGERLPTIRSLAERLDLNRDTVAAAYEALAAEGIVDARVGRGTFVRGLRARAGAAGAVAISLSRHAERLLELERARVAYGAGRGAIPLHALKPDPEHFPLEAFRRSLLRVLRDGGAELLGYGDQQGHLGLREVLAERLRVHGVPVGPESIVLCQGASQGIALSLRLFADAEQAVAVEEPTYPNALAAIAACGVRAVPVPMRAEGADLDALDRALARPEVRGFYTIPTFHNPMGVTTSLAHRRELLALAARHGKAVIEDNYEMDLRYAGRPVPTLAGLDEDGLVVQLLSFSKSLFPGVRAGAIVARGRSIDALLALRHAADLGGALPLQAALADFVRSGAYDRHLAAQRRRLRARRDALLEGLARELPEGASWIVPEGGLQLWLELPEPFDSREVHADALRAGVLVAPGFQFLVDGRPSRGLRLSIGQADEAALVEGARRLGQVLRERLAAEPRRSGSASIQV
jgi:DNA-binding transcriptional MocR family regulator